MSADGGGQSPHLVLDGPDQLILLPDEVIEVSDAAHRLVLERLQLRAELAQFLQHLLVAAQDALEGGIGNNRSQTRTYCGTVHTCHVAGANVPSPGTEWGPMVQRF